jgi:hypothetical protein
VKVFSAIKKVGLNITVIDGEADLAELRKRFSLEGENQ